MKISCLCLTRNRREWLPQAIRCFEAQTHPDRELLIVADGVSVADLIPADPRVRLIEAPEGSRIGAKRNLGCELAAGALVAHWDDDDFSAPERLADQAARLETTGAAVTGFHSMRFTDGSRWWLYQGERNYALGTSLFYRREWWKQHPFPVLQVGEDNQFVMEAAAAGQLAATVAGELMHATIHAGNTSPRIIGSGWTEL
jgi:glycosyltransferase involved in cell wall biosynthesis